VFFSSGFLSPNLEWHKSEGVSIYAELCKNLVEVLFEQGIRQMAKLATITDLDNASNV
jgi:hypothetical protein